MANEKNLVQYREQSPSERRENARKAGKASGEARRRKKTMKDTLTLLLSLKPTELLLEDLKSLGIKESSIDNQMAVMVSVFQAALSGNIRAAEFLRDTVGDKIDDIPESGVTIIDNIPR